MDAEPAREPERLPFDVATVNLDDVSSVVLRRLIEEVRSEAVTQPSGYNRIYNRYMGGGGPYNRTYSRHNR